MDTKARIAREIKAEQIRTAEIAREDAKTVSQEAEDAEQIRREAERAWTVEAAKVKAEIARLEAE